MLKLGSLHSEVMHEVGFLLGDLQIQNVDCIVIEDVVMDLGSL